jgi:hypothetical protein
VGEGGGRFGGVGRAVGGGRGGVEAVVQEEVGLVRVLAGRALTRLCFRGSEPALSGQLVLQGDEGPARNVVRTRYRCAQFDIENLSFRCILALSSSISSRILRTDAVIESFGTLVCRRSWLFADQTLE